MLSMTLNRPLSFWNMMYEEQFDKVVENNGNLEKQQVPFAYAHVCVLGVVKQRVRCEE